jgi:hypothetical protein
MNRPAKFRDGPAPPDTPSLARAADGDRPLRELSFSLGVERIKLQPLSDSGMNTLISLTTAKLGFSLRVISVYEKRAAFEAGMFSAVDCWLRWAQDRCIIYPRQSDSGIMAW